MCGRRGARHVYDVHFLSEDDAPRFMVCSHGRCKKVVFLCLLVRNKVIVWDLCAVCCGILLLLRLCLF